MAVILLPAIPAILTAIGEAVAYTTIILGGAYVASEAIEAIDEALEDDEVGTATDTCVGGCSSPACPPCSPPAGTIRVERVDHVPPSRAHYPCPGDHAHLVQMNQVPYPNCRCFWNKASPDVQCLNPGDPLPYPMK
jgi:type VI secretion system secreted protein VgrG